MQRRPPKPNSGYRKPAGKTRRFPIPPGYTHQDRRRREERRAPRVQDWARGDWTLGEKAREPLTVLRRQALVGTCLPYTVASPSESPELSQ